MPKPYAVTFEPNVRMPLRDGTVTYADVFRPRARGSFPALLQRTPYDKSSPRAAPAPWTPCRPPTNGFAVVIQDVRGRYSSQGEFYTFANEANDGHDSVEWVASRPWCTGRVGMYGVSYVGATQWLAAKAGAPSLGGIAPGVTASNYHEGWAWQGGAFELGFNLSWAVGPLTWGNWAALARRLGLSADRQEQLLDTKDGLTARYNHLPLQDLPISATALLLLLRLARPPRVRRLLEEPQHRGGHPDIRVPAFNFGGWYDIFLAGTIRNFALMRQLGATEDARRGQRLVLGPWIHGGAPISVAGEYNFGTRAAADAMDLRGQTLRFYDHWLKGEDNGVMDEQPVLLFVMGENVWRRESEWPLARAENTRFFLRSLGAANTLNGDGWLTTDSPGDEPPDMYRYNPWTPCPPAAAASAAIPPSWRRAHTTTAPSSPPRRPGLLDAAPGPRTWKSRAQ